jgi:hypothetical protein
MHGRIDGSEIGAQFLEVRICKIIRAEKGSAVPPSLPLVECDIRAVTCNYARIAAFYKSVADEAARYAADVLKSRAEADYLASEDKRKKYRFKRFRYCVICTPRYVSADVVEVTITSSLTKNADVCAAKSCVHTWDLTRELMIPPRYLKSSSNSL